ncbi:MAG: hypothetical protein ACYTEZ_11845 [Planctomycetota bacterium]|jgi:hypothetical protein
MRTTLLLLLTGLALAQGPRGQPPVGERLRLRGTAGPGYIQQHFVDDLAQRTADAFGRRRGERMLRQLRESGLDPEEVTRLMAGALTKGRLREGFGARSNEVKRVEEALDHAIVDKDKRFFFGILILTMVGDLKMDPTGQFCRQVAATCGAIDEKQVARLFAGNVSRKTIAEIFAFTHRADQTEMQDILNRTWDSPYFHHPMARSIQRRGKKGRKRYDPSLFPKLREGMPGFGGEFAKGMAGGLPFDPKTPPCAFFGKNLEEFFDAMK